MKFLNDVIVLANEGCSLVLHILAPDVPTLGRHNSVAQVLAGCHPWKLGVTQHYWLDHPVHLQESQTLGLALLGVLVSGELKPMLICILLTNAQHYL